MPSKELLGNLLTIPTINGPMLAKIIFQSDYFADTLAIKVFCGTHFDPETAEHDATTKPFKIYYTGGSAVRSKRWAIVAHTTVTEEERHLTKRTSGGEVWLEDKHLGAASEAELGYLPKMLVYGYKLVEKHAARPVEG